MTQAVAHILTEVEQLSLPERTELRRAIVERVPMSDDLTDDDFAALAADMFRTLDAEEDPEKTRSTSLFEYSPSRMLVDKVIVTEHD